MLQNVEKLEKALDSGYQDTSRLARLLMLIENRLLGVSLDRYLFLKIKNRYDKVFVEDIISLESAKNYTYIKTESKRYVVRSTMKELHDSFPTKQFCRVHKSHVVNLLHISSIEHAKVKVAGHEIPIGKCYREHFMTRLRLLS